MNDIGQGQDPTQNSWGLSALARRLIDLLHRVAHLSIMLTSLTCCAGADILYNVSLDSAPLVGNSSSPFALNFQLTSGDPNSGVVNAVTLSRFSFGTGSPIAGSPFPHSGNVSGDLGSSVELNTSGGTFFSEFSQYFAPGASVTFQLVLTTNSQTSAIPDEFTFQLIDRTHNEVSTTDPSGSNSLIVIDLIGSSLSPQTYTASGDGLTITPVLSGTVPEPSTLILVAIILASAAILRHKPQAHRKSHPATESSRDCT